MNASKVNAEAYATTVRVNPVHRTVMNITDNVIEHQPHQEEIVELYNSLGEIQRQVTKRLIGVA